MTVDRSRGVGRHASSPTANRIKKDEIPPGGLDTLTPGREAGSDNSASSGNTPAGRSVCVCCTWLRTEEIWTKVQLQRKS